MKRNIDENDNEIKENNLEEKKQKNDDDDENNINKNDEIENELKDNVSEILSMDFDISLNEIFKKKVYSVLRLANQFQQVIRMNKKLEIDKDKMINNIENLFVTDIEKYIYNKYCQISRDMKEHKYYYYVRNFVYYNLDYFQHDIDHNRMIRNILYLFELSKLNIFDNNDSFFYTKDKKDNLISSDDMNRINFSLFDIPRVLSIFFKLQSKGIIKNKFLNDPDNCLNEQYKDDINYKYLCFYAHIIQFFANQEFNFLIADPEIDFWYSHKINEYYKGQQDFYYLFSKEI